MTADVGLIGLAVMGENLALNMERNGFTVAVFNRTVARVEEFTKTGRGAGKKFVGCTSIEQFCASLKKPRKILVMVKAGPPVDQVVATLLPHLEAGDIVIDGGNSHFPDTERRTRDLKDKNKILFVGCGVSGGEEGALNGPSLMPGGATEAWPHIQPILQAIAAQVPNDPSAKCCEWIGAGGAGHFVKMVHNGIEYGDMQLITEAYHVLHSMAGLSNSQIADIFEEWNKGELNSYLIEITSRILRTPDDVVQGQSLVDAILDAAEQKGTGKWTGQEALERGVAVTMIAEAVFARCVSTLKTQRVAASQVLQGPIPAQLPQEEVTKLVANVRDAVFSAKVVSYAQGFALMKSAGEEYKWNLDYGAIAMTWRNGCIIRSAFLGDIRNAFTAANAEKKPLDNLMMAPHFAARLNACQAGWRNAVVAAVSAGIPTPAMSSALSYFDGYRTPRLPANLLQAQRDYFGAHTFERVDKPRGEHFHCNWTGHGGTTTSTPPSH